MSDNKSTCTGDATTCLEQNGECMECGERDCPSKDPCHYFVEGCYSCYPPPETPEEKKAIDALTVRIQAQIVKHKVKWS